MRIERPDADQLLAMTGFLLSALIIVAIIAR
jgi:hypothetical protein